MRTAQAGPLAGMIVQVALLVALAATVGLGVAGWLVGIVGGLVVFGALARGLARADVTRLGPATWVTIVRMALAGGVAALTADSFAEPDQVAVLVGLAAAALVLDALDGPIARRTGSTSEFGARLDGEVDAFLILALSVFVAQSLGPWVLAIGAARYLFIAAGWWLPWMRAPLPPRFWRKVAAATQGIVLTVAAADVLPLDVARVAVLVALAVLAESFGRDVWWLFAHRGASPIVAAPPAEAAPARRHGPVRRTLGIVLTLVSVAVVWAALVAPSQPGRMEPGAFARVPLEGLLLVVLAVVLPTPARRVVAWIVGPLLAVLVVVKALDIGFLTSFDRRFDPVSDWTFAGIGIETLREAIGRSTANLVIAGIAVAVVGALLLTTLAVLRLTRVAARHRRWSLAAVGALGAVWALSLALGAESMAGIPVASTSAVDLARDEVQAVRAGVEGQAIFIGEVDEDRFRDTPADRLLTGLRGKDVLVVMVESYGRVAVQDSDFSPSVVRTLDEGTANLADAGYAARSGFLTSSTFGGLSWLAHSTLHSGMWVDSQLRYDYLVGSGRFTLSKAFKRAGWRLVDFVPAHNRDWPEGRALYGYDAIYDRRNLGYRGSPFGYGPMPDQYLFAQLERLELSRPERPPLFAELDLVSSHTPWTDLPRLVDWNAVGDGSIFRHVGPDRQTQGRLWSDPAKIRAAYGRSIEYDIRTIVSFIERYGDDDLVVVMLGDHQPATVVTGEGASHDVPISIIAHDPAVLDQIADWGFQEGLHPDPDAPVWPMNAFRDRFLTAFGSEPSEP